MVHRIVFICNAILFCLTIQTKTQCAATTSQATTVSPKGFDIIHEHIIHAAKRIREKSEYTAVFPTERLSNLTLPELVQLRKAITLISDQDDIAFNDARDNCLPEIAKLMHTRALHG